MWKRGGVGWGGEPDRVSHERLHVSRTRSLAPGPFALRPPGASRQGGGWASSPAHRAPSALPRGPQPLPGLRVLTGARTPAGLPDTRRRGPAPLPAQFRGSSVYTPGGSSQRPLPPAGSPLPRLQRRVSPGAPDSVPAHPPAASLWAPTLRGPHPGPVSSASGRLPSPPGPAPPHSRADTV